MQNTINRPGYLLKLEISIKSIAFNHAREDDSFLAIAGETDCIMIMRLHKDEPPETYMEIIYEQHVLKLSFVPAITDNGIGALMVLTSEGVLEILQIPYLEIYPDIVMIEPVSSVSSAGDITDFDIHEDAQRFITVSKQGICRIYQTNSFGNIVCIDQWRGSDDSISSVCWRKDVIGWGDSNGRLLTCNEREPSTIQNLSGTSCKWSSTLAISWALICFRSDILPSI